MNKRKRHSTNRSFYTNIFSLCAKIALLFNSRKKTKRRRREKSCQRARREREWKSLLCGQINKPKNVNQDILWASFVQKLWSATRKQCQIGVVKNSQEKYSLIKVLLFCFSERSTRQQTPMAERKNERTEKKFKIKTAKSMKRIFKFFLISKRCDIHQKCVWVCARRPSGWVWQMSTKYAFNQND